MKLLVSSSLIQANENAFEQMENFNKIGLIVLSMKLLNKFFLI